MSGLLAGAQAALLSVIVVVMPALAAYVATSADPANADVGWTQSVAVGAVLWLLGHGAVVHAGGATLSFVPLGITMLALFVAFASARRSAQPTRGAWLAGIGAYLGVVVLVVVVLGAAGPLGAGPGAVARALLGAGAVASAGLGLGLLRPGVLRDVTAPVWSRVSPLVRASAAAGVIVTCVLVAVAALVTVGWVVAGRAAAGDVVDGLGLDVFSGALLALAQLAVVPNLVLWALAWVAGPGFAVGTGTLYSPTEVIGGPLPALPILGALPADVAPGAAASWAPLLVVVAGAIAGWWLHRRVISRAGWEPFAVATGAALSAGLCAGLLTALAAGSVGPGRLTQVGGPALSVAVTIAGLSLVGALLATVPTDPVVRERVESGCRTIWKRLRGSERAQHPQGTQLTETAQHPDSPAE